MSGAEYRNISDAVHWLATYRGPGRYVCPKCAGGSDGEASLSLRIDQVGGVHWRCFRSLCGTSGGPRGQASLFAALPANEPRVYTRPLRQLTAIQDQLIADKFDLDPSIIRGYSEMDDRFILSVFGPVGYNKRGSVAYSFNRKPKSLTYNEKPGEPFIHYGGPDKGPLVIVEDWFSAEKVGCTDVARGVAIMGTHLSQEMVSELVANSDGPTYVALDRDAYTKTLLYLSRYREQFSQGLFAWSLSKDLKYETKERIIEALNGKTDFSVNVGKPEHA